MATNSNNSKNKNSVASNNTQWSSSKSATATAAKKTNVQSTNNSTFPTVTTTATTMNSTDNNNSNNNNNSNINNNNVVVEQLQRKLNESSVKHTETVYWLQLELNTMKQSKQAVEERMAELFRDLQDLHDNNRVTNNNNNNNNNSNNSTNKVNGKNKHIDNNNSNNNTNTNNNYERMIRIMNNQINLIRNSSDSIVKSLKDELSDVMDEKSRTEISLLNKLSTVEKEKRELQQQMAQMEKTQSTINKISNSSTKKIISSILEQPPLSPNQGVKATIRPPLPPQRHNSIDDDNNDTSLLLELKRLREENTRLKQDLNKKNTKDKNRKSIDVCDIKKINELNETVNILSAENNRLKTDLTQEIEKSKENTIRWKTQIESLIGKSIVNNNNNKAVVASDSKHNTTTNNNKQNNSPIVIETWVKEQCKNVNVILDRVSYIWENADETLRNIQDITNVLQQQQQQQHSSDDDTKRTLSVLETASLVQGQIKVSLMLTELKLRNCLYVIQNSDGNMPFNQVLETTSSKDKNSNNVQIEIEKIQNETVISIEKIVALVENQLKELHTRAIKESIEVKEIYEEKNEGLRKLMEKHIGLEGQVQTLQKQINDNITNNNNNNNVENIHQEEDNDNTITTYVNQNALVTLQNEILHVVNTIKEKNLTIVKLNSVINEYKIREKTLMDELKRYINEQANKQLQEQQLIMKRNAAANAQYIYDDDDDDESDDDDDDDVESSIIATEEEEVTIYDEKTIEETSMIEYEEKTVYDEEEIIP